MSCSSSNLSNVVRSETHGGLPRIAVVRLEENLVDTSVPCMGQELSGQEGVEGHPDGG